MRGIAAVATVLALAACQPETSPRQDSAPAANAPASAPAAAAPAAAAPAAAAAAGAVDLKPQIVETVVSADQSGAKIALERTPSSIKLTMPRTGVSRVQLAATLDPGEYDVHLVSGPVEVQEKSPDGFGAFFGPENDRASTIELKPNAEQRVRISVPARKQVFFSLGFGGWGKAKGSAEIKTLEIVKAPKA